MKEINLLSSQVESVPNLDRAKSAAISVFPLCWWETANKKQIIFFFASSVISEAKLYKQLLKFEKYRNFLFW